MQYLVKEEKENKEERKYKNNIFKKKNGRRKDIQMSLHIWQSRERAKETERSNPFLLIWCNLAFVETKQLSALLPAKYADDT